MTELEAKWLQEGAKLERERIIRLIRTLTFFYPTTPSATAAHIATLIEAQARMDEELAPDANP